MRISVTLLIASIFALAGCGGGGNVRSESLPPLESQQPELDGDEQNTDDDTDKEKVSELEPEPVSVRDTLGALIASSSTVTDANTIDGSTFLWNVTVQPTPASLTLDGITRYDDVAFHSLGSRRGVERGAYEELNVAEFGGWMSHSFFLVNVWNPVDRDPLHPSESAFSHTYSIGSASGSNPTTGSATWTGVMAGIDVREGASTFGNIVEGDAQVSIDDFYRPAIDVMLSNIRDRQTGGQHGNITWNNLQLSRGAFSTSNLSGRFYGPNHEEVGGVFLRNQIDGAFGAGRQ